MTAVGLSKDTLHVYVGLLLFLVSATLVRRPIGSLFPCTIVVIATVLGEALDARDDVLTLGYWRFGASARDIANTMCWPTILMLLARYTNLLRVR